ncbi:MAG: hypothetical protein IJH92_03370 [Mogibacterium sp.]|nr:hypothetical protein [Mogibacterium sp.]
MADNSLADCILEQMKNRISEAFPDNKPVSEENAFDADALEQQMFAQKYSMDFVGRNIEIREVMSYLRGDGGRAWIRVSSISADSSE